MTTFGGAKRTSQIGRWSAEKLDLLRCYLGGSRGRGGFLPATTSAHQRYYIDLFSGPGQNKIRDTGEIVDGSPLVALKAGPPHFTHLWWVDADEKNASSLEEHRRELGDERITVLLGNGNDRVLDILHVLPKQFPSFAFLDPYGVELDWQTIIRLASHKPTNKVELFILFAYNHGIARLLPYDDSRMMHADILDRLMPDPVAWRRLYEMRVSGQIARRDFRRAFLEEYVRGLRALGYKYVPPPRLVSTPDNRPLYFMVFASDHPAGERIMDWCLQHVRQSQIQASLLPYDQRY